MSLEAPDQYVYECENCEYTFTTPLERWTLPRICHECGKRNPWKLVASPTARGEAE